MCVPASAFSQLIVFADDAKILRFAEWERLLQYCAENTEDRGVRAVSERQRENRDDGERRMLDQLAKAVADVGRLA